MLKISAWIPPLAWMAIIYYFSSHQRLSVSESLTLNFLFFKTLHVLEYAVLFVLIFRALNLSIARLRVFFRQLMALIFTVSYALSDELHQMYVPTREGRLRDVIIDLTGALLAWLIISKFIPALPNRLRKPVGRLLNF